MDSSHAAQPTALQRFLGSRLVTGTGMFLSRYTPPFLGYAVASLIAGLINRLKPGVYWIVYANLRQVMGAQVSERELHRLVRQVFRNNAVHNYELCRLVGRGLEAIRATVCVPPEFWACLRDARQRGQGVIIAGTHTGNFDLAILALATHGVEVQLLGLAASPAGGFDLMDRMRRNAGVNLTSISASSLRQAIQRLRAGGVVMTGVDRPVGDEMLSPLSGGSWRGVEFFGGPSLLPTGHVRLALKADAAIAVASPYREARGRIVVRTSPLLEMARTGDPEEELRVNLRRVTAWLEEFIRARPEQWAVFTRVWPDE